jgi:hypothetical protein
MRRGVSSRACHLRPPAHTVTLIVLSLVLVREVPTALAQQFVTDDAAVVERDACQVEAWHAQRATWVLPACHLLRNLELTAGIGRVEVRQDVHEARYVFQAKTLFRQQEVHGFGLGAVAGVGLDPLGQIVARRIDAVFAYVPLSIAAADGRVALHQNVGWAYASEPLETDAIGAAGERRHALTWGMRIDVALAERLTAIAELFGQSRLSPEYQAGLRVALVRERLLADVSYTASAAGGTPGAFAIGVAWTPPPWRRRDGTPAVSPPRIPPERRSHTGHPSAREFRRDGALAR